ncbi:MAG: tetratricopeptide repeat protein [Bacteroidota bacterium]
MTYKSIFKGRLEFGSPKSYDKVLKMYQHRVENYYKSDVLLNEEEIFDEEAACLNVPRFITQGSEKSWKNTVSLLEYVAQFAIAGNLGAWMTEEGKVLRHGVVEPRSDRVAVQAFLKGRDLIEETGKESEAMEALNRAIEKYERHAQAYERRGYVNYLLKNYDDALYDYNKSIDISPSNPEAYFGRASVKVLKEDYQGAISDFDMTIKCSIPLQPIYWKARRLKADCYLKLGDHKGALLDLRLFTKRLFKSSNPNYLYRRVVFFNYGKALLETGNNEDALAAFDAALNLQEGNDNLSEAERLVYRGIARKACGKNGYLQDWKAAAKLGSKKASELLKKR